MWTDYLKKDKSYKIQRLKKKQTKKKLTSAIEIASAPKAITLTYDRIASFRHCTRLTVIYSDWALNGSSLAKYGPGDIIGFSTVC